MRVILFNFYPYRERREAAVLKRYGMAMAGTASVAIALAFAVSQEFQARVDSKLTYLNKLETFKAQVAEHVQQTKEIEARVEVLSRQVRVLKSIERDSMQVSHWLSFFEQTKPVPVMLNRIFTENGALQLQGTTTTVDVLANWVEQMEVGNALFDSVGLIKVQEQEPSSASVVEDPASSHGFSLTALPRREGL